MTRDHQCGRHRGARHGQLVEKPALGGPALGLALGIALESLRGVEKLELVSGLLWIAKQAGSSRWKFVQMHWNYHFQRWKFVQMHWNYHYQHHC